MIVYMVRARNKEGGVPFTIAEGIVFKEVVVNFKRYAQLKSHDTWIEAEERV